MRKLKKTHLSRFIAGYKKANKLIATERRQRLSQMTVEDSLREYDRLCKLYAHPRQKGSGRLEDKKVSFLIKRRQAIDKLSKALKSR